MIITLFHYKTGTETHSIETDAIAYLKNVKRIIELYIWNPRDNSITLASKFYSTVSDAMSRLPASQFLRCERSHIVNMGHIQLMEKNAFILKDNDETNIPISRSQKTDAAKAFFMYQESIKRVNL